MTRRVDIDLPCAPRCLRDGEAARYVGMSATTFRSLVDEGVMPQPFRIRSLVLWDRRQLDAAIDALKEPAHDEGSWE